MLIGEELGSWIHPDLQAAIDRNMKWLHIKCRLSEFNEELREDLLQTILMEIYGSNDNFSKKEIQSADAWVKKIASNVSYEHKRKQMFKNSSEVSYDDHFQAQEGSAAHTASSEAMGVLLSSISFIEKNFKAVDREIMTLHFMKEPHESIAEIVGMTVGSIRNRISFLKKEINKYTNRGSDSVQ